jgi:hypothetical protein
MPRRLVIFALASALVLAGCSPGVTRSVSGVILSARGEIRFLGKGSNTFRPLDSHVRVSADTVFRTSGNAQLNLVLIPGALAQIPGDSEVKIEELKLTKDGNETGDPLLERRARVELRRGAIIVLFEGVARFEIDTREATITVLPSCLFRANVDETRTRLTVVRGDVSITPKNGEEATVVAGETWEWPSGRGATPLADDPQAKMDSTRAVEAARELGELATAKRDRLPL